MPESGFQVPPGTLEMLVLKVLSREPEHGWGIGHRLQQLSRGRPKRVAAARREDDAAALRRERPRRRQSESFT